MTTRGPRRSAGCQYLGRYRHARRSGPACRTRVRRRAGLHGRGHVLAPRTPGRIPGQMRARSPALSRGRCPIPFAVDRQHLLWTLCAVARRQSPGRTTMFRRDIRARHSPRDLRWRRERRHPCHAHPTGHPTVGRYQRRRRNRRVRRDWFPWGRCPCPSQLRRCAHLWLTRRRHPSRNHHHGRHCSPGRRCSPGRYQSPGQRCRPGQHRPGQHRRGQHRRDREHHHCRHRPDVLARN